MYKKRFDDDKMIALVALLIATIISVSVLYALTFVLDIGIGTSKMVDVQSCYAPVDHSS